MTENDPTDLPEFDEWPEAPAPAPRKGLIMRNPLLLGVVAVMAVLLMSAYWPVVEPVFFETGDCGDVTERPSIRKNTPEKLPQFENNTFCTLRGVIQSLKPLAAVPKDAEIESLVESPREQLAGVKYYVKLTGDQVYAVLAADDEKIYNYFQRKDTVLGFPVDAEGHLFDPSTSERYSSVERGLRSNFGVPDSQQIWVFNTTATAADLWPKALAFCALAFTALMALFGLGRLLMLRRRDA